MDTKRTHYYFAEANAVNATLHTPLRAEVRPQAYLRLPDNGGYFSERAERFRFEGVISVDSAYTQAAGYVSDKPEGGWATLVTAVVERLNVLDVVTADRVVAQISVVHPRIGYVPSVTFLGTRFENLQIAGRKIEPKLNLGFCGPKPGDDKLYLEDPGFRSRVEEQHKRMAEASDAVRGKYSGKLPDPGALRKEWDDYNKADYCKRKDIRPTAGVDCSLVDSLGKTDPWRSVGNAIEVPDFGTIFLAELRVECDVFELTMIRMEMGCIGSGTVMASSGKMNGSTVP
jgi:hypothetical protein